MDSFAQASHLGSGPSQLSLDRKAELSLPQSWPTGRSLPASTTAPKSDNVLPRQLPVWQEREQQDSEDSLRQHTLRSPLNLQLVEKVNQVNTLNGRRIHQQEIQVNWAYQSNGSQREDDQAMLNQVKKSWKDNRRDLRRSEEHTANLEVPEHVFESTASSRISDAQDTAPMYVEQVFERARRHYRNQSYRRCIADCTSIIE